jgi:uncharacterized membrane protein
MLASLLGYGSWLASAIIAIGLGGTMIDETLGFRIVMAGIGCFILLPVCRLLFMLIVFARQRDWRFVGVTATVLTILFVSFALGALLSVKLEH